MYTEETPDPQDLPEDPEYTAAQKRIKKIKAFYKDLTSWAGTSIMLIGINLFTTGDISWAKYPVFFWGIFIAAQFFNILRLQRLDKEWEARQFRRFTGRVKPEESYGTPEKDYSEELLNREEKIPENLSDYRKVAKPWKDQDLV